MYISSADIIAGQSKKLRSGKILSRRRKQKSVRNKQSFCKKVRNKRKMPRELLKLGNKRRIPRSGRRGCIPITLTPDSHPRGRGGALLVAPIQNRGRICVKQHGHHLKVRMSWMQLASLVEVIMDPTVLARLSLMHQRTCPKRVLSFTEPTTHKEVCLHTANPRRN